jgi:hypothetical protein
VPIRKRATRASQKAMVHVRGTRLTSRPPRNPARRTLPRSG